MRDIKIRATKTHPLEWLFEPLEDHPGYMRRKMFGAECAYLNGRLVLAITDGGEPWNGLLVVTSREHHAALQESWKQLKSHTVLGKWLYISQNNPAFEKVACAIVESVWRGDERIGVEPKPRKRKVSTPALTDAQRGELDRRLKAHHNEPSSGSSWQEVKKRVLKRK